MHNNYQLFVFDKTSSVSYKTYDAEHYVSRKTQFRKIMTRNIFK